MTRQLGEARLEGKTALITGGTQSIGLGIATRFCEEGARVVIAGRQQGNGKQTAENLATQGYDIAFEPVNMADVTNIIHLVGAAVSRLGGLDVLVNNAGIGASGTIRWLEEDEWDETQAVNLRGPVFCMQTAAEYMRSQEGGGSIINIASIDAPYGHASYAASKAGLIAASQVAAREFAPHIRVNTIAPGITDTGMTAVIPQEFRDTLSALTPLEHTAIPEEVASACVYFASDEASFTTGALLRIDGGLRLGPRL